MIDVETADKDIATLLEGSLQLNVDGVEEDPDLDVEDGARS